MSACYILRIHDLDLSVYLGCLPAERGQLQTVRLNLEILFQQKPKACESDELLESICYDQIGNLLMKFVRDREFKLIEFLAERSFVLLKESFPGAQFNIKVHKLNPPVDWKNTGTSFEIREFD